MTYWVLEVCVSDASTESAADGRPMLSEGRRSWALDHQLMDLPRRVRFSLAAGMRSG